MNTSPGREVRTHPNLGRYLDKRAHLSWPERREPRSVLGVDALLQALRPGQTVRRAERRLLVRSRPSESRLLDSSLAKGLMRCNCFSLIWVKSTAKKYCCFGFAGKRFVGRWRRGLHGSGGCPHWVQGAGGAAAGAALGGFWGDHPRRSVLRGPAFGDCAARRGQIRNGLGPSIIVPATPGRSPRLQP